MNKGELISAIAEKMGASKAEAGRTVELVLGTIIDGAVDGECVVPGLGKIVKVDTAARSGETNGVKWSKEASQTLKLRLSKAGKCLVGVNAK